MKPLRAYDAHKTERMNAIHGTPLASFTSRAGAFVIDFMLAFFIFLGLLMLGARAADYFGITTGDINLKFGFGFFQYFIHSNRRTVHDRIAETIVIQDWNKRIAAKEKK